jgi:hypothetical protein
VTPCTADPCRRASSAPTTARRAPPAGRRNALAACQAATYSASIDKTPRQPKEAAMNTRTTHQALSFVSAFFVTLVMLASVNVLATSEPGAAQATHLAGHASGPAKKA